MKNLAIIGTGITGLSTANLLKSRFEVTLFEKSSKPGGLIKCDRINDSLFHRVGGHVFNSSNPQVLDWFWDFFDREKEFTKAQRNAKILLNNEILGYPLRTTSTNWRVQSLATLLMIYWQLSRVKLQKSLATIHTLKLF